MQFPSYSTHPQLNYHHKAALEAVVPPRKATVNSNHRWFYSLAENDKAWRPVRNVVADFCNQLIQTQGYSKREAKTYAKSVVQTYMLQFQIANYGLIT